MTYAKDKPRFGHNEAQRRPPNQPTIQPACMSRSELDSWLDVARYVNNGTADPCSDCIAPFAAEMRAEGRCNGIPGLVRKRSRKEDTADRRRFRLIYIRQRLVSLGIDAAHAERVV